MSLYYHDESISGVQINDGVLSETSTYSSKKIEELVESGSSDIEQRIANNWGTGGYNLIRFPYSSPKVAVFRSITFTTSDDGSVHVEGTTSDTVYFSLAAQSNSYLSLDTNKVYRLSCNIESELDFDSDVVAQLYYIDSEFTSSWRIININREGDMFRDFNKTVKSNDGGILIRVLAGKTVNFTIRPMLYELTSPSASVLPYQRYALGNTKLTDKLDTKADSSIVLMDNLFIADNFTMKDIATVKSVDNGDGTYTINTYLNSEGKFPNNTPFFSKVNNPKLDLYNFKGKKLYLRLDIISGDMSISWLGFVVTIYKEDGTNKSAYPRIINKDIGVHQIVSYNVDDMIAEGYRYIAFQPWLSNDNVYTDVVMRVVATTEEWNYGVRDFKYTGYGLNTNLGNLPDNLNVTNSALDTLRYGTSGGGLNILDLNKRGGDTSFKEISSGYLTNTATDSKTFFDFAVQVANWSSSSNVKTLANVRLDGSTKSATLNFTIPNGYTDLVIRHIGDSNNLVVASYIIPESNLVTNKPYTLTITCSSTNPSVVGGIVITELALFEGNEAHDFVPYIPSISMIHNFILGLTPKSITCIYDSHVVYYIQIGSLVIGCLLNGGPLRETWIGGINILRDGLLPEPYANRPQFGLFGGDEDAYEENRCIVIEPSGEITVNKDIPRTRMSGYTAMFMYETYE